jgi:putative membrane protein
LRNTKLISAVGLALGLVLAASLVLHFGIDAIEEAFGRLGWIGFAAVAVFHLALIALMGASWWLLGQDRSDARPGRFIWGRLIRDSASEVLPLSQMGGFVSGARALAVSGVAGTFSAASTVVDMSVELVSKLPYTFLGLGLLCVLRPDSHLIFPVVVGVLVLAAAAALFLLLQARGGGLGDRLWAKLARRCLAEDRRAQQATGSSGVDTRESETIHQAIQQLHARRPALALAFLGHLLSWFLGGIETWLTLQLMGVRIDLGPALVIDSLASALRSAAFFIPNAVGVQEGAYLMLSALFGVAPGTALALSLVKRGRDWAIGVPAMLAWHLAEGHRARLGLLGRERGR